VANDNGKNFVVALRRFLNMFFFSSNWTLPKELPLRNAVCVTGLLLLNIFSAQINLAAFTIQTVKNKQLFHEKGFVFSRG